MPLIFLEIPQMPLPSAFELTTPRQNHIEHVPINLKIVTILVLVLGRARNRNATSYQIVDRTRHQVHCYSSCPLDIS